MDTASISEPEEFAAILYAEPGALGLMANILCALMVAVDNIQGYGSSSDAQVVSGVTLLVVGGLLQAIAGLLSFRRYDHLTASAFLVFAAMWSAMGIGKVMGGAESLRLASLSGMVGFMGVAIVLCTCALTVNFILPPVLVGLLMTLVFESVGLFYTWGRKVAAGFEMFIVLASMYAVVVMILKGVSQRYILPGFGNAPVDPLLIKTKGAPSASGEKKKLTKYAEPMGLGFLGNVVPAVMFAAHHLGYFSDFRPAMAMLVVCPLCQGLASYYSFLRHDFFHAVSFVVYGSFWTSKAVLQLFGSIEFSDLFNSRTSFYGQWGLIILLLLLTVVSATKNNITFIFNAAFSLTGIMSLDHISLSVSDYTFGITSAILSVMSLYIGLATLENSIAEKPVIYIGSEIVTKDRLVMTIGRMFCKGADEKLDDKEYTDYDKIDLKIVDTIVFVASSISLTALSATEVTNNSLPVPYVVVAVGLFVFASRLAFAAGSLSRAYSSLVMSLIYATWGVVLLDDSLVSSLRPVAIGLLCLFTVVGIISPTLNQIWISCSAVHILMCLTLVLTTFEACPWGMLLISAMLAAVVSVYAAGAEIINTSLGCHVVPVGQPLLKPSSTPATPPPCPLYPSHRSSAILQVASKLRDDGAVMGVPTDTVYALAASCKHPESIKKIYFIKNRPAEKPICLCLSSVAQLEAVNPPFSPLLWRFMRHCYPGGISCVVPKGDWLQRLGLGDSATLLGTDTSIMIRVPDSAVLAKLVSVSGPVALTSANPSGGEDSTHHDMVINSLGHKLDGVVCDGTSRELVASTVVNCLKIDQGVISYFRIGCTPQEVVDAHFEKAKAEVMSP